MLANFGQVSFRRSKMPRFEMPKIFDHDLSNVNIYELESGERFWFDSNYYRAVTDDPNKYIQFIWRVYLGTPIHCMYLVMDGRAIQFAGKDGEFLPMQAHKNQNGKSIWQFGSIGKTLKYHTGDIDSALNIYRPMLERNVILAADSKFSSLEQQEQGLDFFTSVLSRYEAGWSRFRRGIEQQAIVEFTRELKQQVERGDFVE